MTLPKKLFSNEINPTLMAQAVRVFMSNQRQSPAKVKTRSEVQGSTRKLFKQKGTGRARHGSVRAPIFVGGGIAHGPDGNQNYTMKMPVKMRRLSLLSALSLRAKEKKVTILEEQKFTGKTSQAAKVKDQFVGKLLLVLSPEDVKERLAWRNLKNVKIVAAKSLTTYDILSVPQLLISPKALAEMEKHYVA